MFLGDPERRRKEKQQTDLDNDYYQRAKAYNKAKTEERIRIAAQKGKLAAQQQANRQPLYKKLIGGAQWLANDVATGNPNQILGGSQKGKRKGQSGSLGIFNESASNNMFSWEEPKQKRKRKRKRK